MPIGRTKNGWLNYKDIIEHYKSSEEVLILSESEFSSYENAFYKSGTHIELNDNVFLINEAMIKKIHIEDPSFGFTFETIVIKALAEAWSSPVERILNASLFKTHENTCTISNGDNIANEVDVIRNPNNV